MIRSKATQKCNKRIKKDVTLMSRATIFVVHCAAFQADVLGSIPSDWISLIEGLFVNLFMVFLQDFYFYF